MPKDVLITPLNAKIEFKNGSSVLDGLIELDSSDNLTITSPNGNLNIGNPASNIVIGEGTATVDIIYQQSGSIKAITGSTLTLGSSDSNISLAAPLALTSNLIIGTSANSAIKFTNNTNSIYAKTLTNGSVSFEGSSGQLFSISDSMSGTIFSVNDISGIPSIEVLDTGLVKLNQYNGETVIGTSAAVGTSMLTIIPKLTTSEGLTIKGLASQSADLFTVQNSSDTQLLKVDASGNVYANPRLFVGTTAYAGDHRFFVVGGVATEVTSVIRGVASQTANLTQWQNSAGTALSLVDAGGNWYSSRAYLGAYALYDSRLNINTVNASDKGIVVRGVASQTGNLQEWQDSSGTVLTRIANAGQLYSGAPLVLGTTYFTSTLSVQTRNSSEAGIVVRGSASQSVSLQQWQNSAGTVIAGVAANGASFFGTTGPLNSSIAAIPTATTASGIIVRAVASQTANLTEWQDSAGNIAAAFNSVGRLITNQRVSIGAQPATPVFDGLVNIANDTSSTRIALIVRGAASQTANLQEWQNSAGTLLLKVTPDGRLGVSSIVATNGTATRLFVSTSTVFNVSITPVSTTTVGLIIQGAASQTASLQQWQNSAGTVLAEVNSAGIITGSNIKMPNTYNVGLGTSVLNAITSGDGNVAIGYNALLLTTTGNDNTAIGYTALDSNTTGTQNVAIGYNSLDKNISGTSNTAVGYQAGQAITGSNNTVIGYWAGGNEFATTTKITTGSNNILIGNSAVPSADTVSNEITLGDSSITRFRIPGLDIDWFGALSEKATVSATASTGTINYDFLTNRNVLYYTSNATGNWTLNIRGNSTNTLNSLLSTGKSLTVVFMNTNGTTAYYPTAFQIDGTAVTPKWANGTAPTAGNASSIDVYTYNIIKTGSATYTVLASQSKFA